MAEFYDNKEYKNLFKWEKLATKKGIRKNKCLSMWMDICGFGSALEDAKWDLTNLQNNGLLILLNRFYLVAAKPRLVSLGTCPNEKLLVINDGIASTVDLINCDKCLSSHTFSFLYYIRDIIETHCLVKKFITKEFNCNIRTVIAGGERAQYTNSSLTGHSALMYDEKKISEEGKKFLEKTFVYNPSEFQMNTAFAKAYSIESLGTKSGITVGGFFIESLFLNYFNSIPNIKIIKKNNKFEFYYKETLYLVLFHNPKINLVHKGLEMDIFEIKTLKTCKGFACDKDIYMEI